MVGVSYDDVRIEKQYERCIFIECA
jgi:hypothetical protein